MAIRQTRLVWFLTPLVAFGITLAVFMLMNRSSSPPVGRGRRRGRKLRRRALHRRAHPHPRSRAAHRLEGPGQVRPAGQRLHPEGARGHQRRLPGQRRARLPARAQDGSEERRSPRGHRAPLRSRAPLRGRARLRAARARAGSRCRAYPRRDRRRPHRAWPLRGGRADAAEDGRPQAEPRLVLARVVLPRAAR